jgi:hypothetical protein
MSAPARPLSAVPPRMASVRDLRRLAISGLARMYRPNEELFAFRIRRAAHQLLLEGSSPRYTAIALMGLAGEDEAVQASVLAGSGVRAACARLVREVPGLKRLGDVALVLWAACTVGHPDQRSVTDRLLAFLPDEKAYPTVEVAWTLAALCAASDIRAEPLRHRLARRLIDSYEPSAATFPHVLGASAGRLRQHVSCFADLVYPTHALARYASLCGDPEAREVALLCARGICARQGPDGQWWWHYDHRSGRIVEPYPVYAVHQDAMAPMALFAVEDATGVMFDAEIGRSLDWLALAPELGGGSLIDEHAGLIWRKVARREPNKLSRYVQAMASRFHQELRVPGLDMILPARVIDYEDRPYHLGWLLYAWPAARLARWERAALPR